MSSNLSFIDNSIIFLYFLIVLSIGLFFGRSKSSSIKQYFLAGKNLNWVVVGTSLFATNISSEHFVGLVGAGSVFGFSVGYFEWLALFILFLLGWVIAPLFLKANIFTVPEFFGKRFDNRSRLYLTLASVFTYLFTKIGVTILAGTIVLKSVLGWDMFMSAVIIILITGLYTVVGGLKSVVYTQVFQTIILVLGAILLSMFGLNEVGGIANLVAALPSDYFQLFRSNSDPNVPWLGMLFGAPIIGIWYWCADQYIVQRILAAKNLKHAQKGTMLAAVLKIFPILLIIFPGLVAAILYPAAKGNMAYSTLISGSLLPVGIKGIVIAGFFAALMSSLASSFNSAASLIALDLFRMKNKNRSESELVLLGRLSTMIFVLLAIALIPTAKLINTNLYLNLQSIQSFIAPPIVSVLIIGIFWKKANSNGAALALYLGGFIGLLKILLTIFDLQFLTNIALFQSLKEMNFLHFSTYLFAFSTLILITGSLVKRNNYESNELSKKMTIKISDLKPNFVVQSTSNFLRKHN